MPKSSLLEPTVHIIQWKLNKDDQSVIKVKLSPEINLGFICDWIWVKTLCKGTFKLASKSLFLKH